MSTGSDDSGAGSSESKEAPVGQRPASAGNAAAAKSAAAQDVRYAPQRKPAPSEIKKPPRKSKLPEATFRTSSKPSGMQPDLGAGGAASRRFKKNGEELVEPDLGEPPNALSALTSKRFKMLRLNKAGCPAAAAAMEPPGADFDAGCGEMGIVISKRRHSQKGTTGFVIAHIEEGGIADR